MNKKNFEKELNIISSILDDLIYKIYNYYNNSHIDNNYIDTLEYKYKELMIK